MLQRGVSRVSRITVNVTLGLSLALLARICRWSGTTGSWNGKVDGAAVIVLDGSNYLSPVYTIQPVVKLVVKPVWQPVGCFFTRYSRLSNRVVQLYSRFNNRLYRVNGVLQSCTELLLSTAVGLWKFHTGCADSDEGGRHYTGKLSIHE